MAAVMLSAKIGMERLYTSIGIGYNPRFGDGYVGSWGIGCIVNMGSRFYFNPELTFGSAWHDVSHYLNFTPSVGYKIGRMFSITAGPSIVWQYGTCSTGAVGIESSKPFFGIYTSDINARHRIIVGAKVGVRMRGE
jgi:long-subunit fatty acid transport protein